MRWCRGKGASCTLGEGVGFWGEGGEFRVQSGEFRMGFGRDGPLCAGTWEGGVGLTKGAGRYGGHGIPPFSTDDADDTDPGLRLRFSPGLCRGAVLRGLALGLAVGGGAGATDLGRPRTTTAERPRGTTLAQGPGLNSSTPSKNWRFCARAEMRILM